MYVCLCKGITDSQIRNAVASGANTMRAVRTCLGVASDCRGCAREVARVFKHASSGDSGACSRALQHR